MYQKFNKFYQNFVQILDDCDCHIGNDQIVMRQPLKKTFYLGNEETLEKSKNILFLIKNSYIFLISIKSKRKTNHKKTYAIKNTISRKIL